MQPDAQGNDGDGCAVPIAMDDDAHARFLKLYTAHQQDLFAYLLAATRDVSEADDLLQEVAIVLWRRFDDYDPSRRFVSWAYGVARNLLLNHYRKVRRHSGRQISIEVADFLVPAEEEEPVEDWREEQRALAECLSRLPAEHRDLLDRRYQQSASLKGIAEAMGQTAGAVNMKLCRIRGALLKCVERRLAREELEGGG